MPHCAEIKNGKVERVIVVQETYGTLTCEQWCEKTYGGEWKQCSYNTYGGKHKLGGTPLRKNYPGIGYVYDKDRDAFIPPKPPYESWIFDEETCNWKAPKEKLKDKDYRWDESKTDWVEMKTL